MQQRRAQRDARTRRRLLGADMAGGLGPHQGLVGQPDHALVERVKRQRHEGQEAQQAQAQQQGAAPGGLAPARQRAALANVPPGFPQRHHERLPAGHHRHHGANQQVLARHKPDQPDRDHQAVDRGHGAVDSQDPALALGGQRGLRVLRAEQIAVTQINPVGLRALGQVGQLQQVGGNEVAVVAHQRVAIDQHRGHAGNQDDVVGQGREQARLGQQPDVNGQGAQRQLGQDAGRRHLRARPLGRKAVGRGRVHIGHGREDDEEQADLAHRAAARLDGQAVRPLVHRLDDRVDEPEQQQIAGRKHAVGEVLGQGLPVLGGQHRGRCHQGQPEQGHGQAEQGARQAGLAAEPGVRVEQRQAQAHHIEPVLLELGLALALEALEDLPGVGRDLGLQQVVAVQGRDELHQLMLGDARARVTGLGTGGVPHLIERAPAITQRDHPPDLGRQAMKALAHRVAEQHPGAPAQPPVQRLDAVAQARAQVAQGVPVFGEEGLHRLVSNTAAAARRHRGTQALFALCFCASALAFPAHFKSSTATA